MAGLKNVPSTWHLSPALEETIVKAVLAQTRFAPGIHEIASPSMERCGLLPAVYCSIAPRITVKRAGVPPAYAELTIDLRRYAAGDPACEHEIIHLYWETGGGGMESGSPNHYDMCCCCGYHPPPFPSLKRIGLFRTVLRLLGGDRS